MLQAYRVLETSGRKPSIDAVGDEISALYAGADLYVIDSDLLRIAFLVEY